MSRVYGLLVVVATGLASMHPADVERDVTICVATDAGIPVAGAMVSAHCERGFSSARAVSIQSETDREGCARLLGESSGHISGTVEAKDFYPTTFVVELGRDKVATNISLVARMRQSPTSLYAKAVSAKFPAIGASIGFDMIAGDWVSPYGSGAIGDMLLRLDKTAVQGGGYDVRLAVSFPHSTDGILRATTVTQFGSALRLPHQAPEVGYGSSFETNAGQTADGQYYGLGEAFNWFVRVSHSAHNEGQGAGDQFYGKIYDGFKLGKLLDDNPVIRFTYYLNPTGSRNLEFDPKQNLFTNLTSMEEVRMP